MGIVGSRSHRAAIRMTEGLIGASYARSTCCLAIACAAATKAASLWSWSTEIFQGGLCVPFAPRIDTRSVCPSGAIVRISCAGVAGGGVGTGRGLGWFGLRAIPPAGTKALDVRRRLACLHRAFAGHSASENLLLSREKLDDVVNLAD
jgi:hypothetical protein